MAKTGSLGTKVTVGTIWLAAANFLERSIGFISTIIISRLLLPEDFGLVAIGVSLMQLLKNFTDLGIFQAVVKFHRSDRAFLDTLFTLSIIRGMIVTSLLLILAFFAEPLFGDQRTIWVIVSLSLAPFILGFTNPKFYEFQRDMNFSKGFIASLTAKVVSVVVTVFLALILRSYWALIIGTIAASITTMCLSYFMQPYRPRLSLYALKELLPFIGSLSGISLIVAVNNKMDNLVLPGIIGLTALGSYYMGISLIHMITIEFSVAIGLALFPAMSALQKKPQEMKNAFMTGIEATAIISLPLAIGITFNANDFTRLILGGDPKWHIVPDIIKTSLPVYGFAVFFSGIHGLAISAERYRSIIYLELAYLFCRVPAIIFAAKAYGIMGAVYANIATITLRWFWCLFVYKSISKDSLFTPLWNVRRSLVSVIVMALFYSFCGPFLNSSLPDIDALRFIVNFALGGSVYMGVHYTLWRLEGRPHSIETSALALFTKALKIRSTPPDLT